MGSKESFSFNPYISFHTIRKMTGAHFWMPEVGYVFNQVEADDTYKKRTLFALLNVGWTFRKGTYLRYGLGVFQTSISGDGGTTTRSNGSSTAEFHLPSESQTSYNSTVNFGIEHFLRNLILQTQRIFKDQLRAFAMQILRITH